MSPQTALKKVRVEGYLLGAILLLMIVGYSNIYINQRDIRLQIKSSCQQRLKARKDTNIHERIPLKAAFNYLGDIALKGAPNAKTPKQRADAIAFGNKFKRYADRVKPLASITC